MSLFCIGSISWCCFVVPLFHWCLSIPLFDGVPIQFVIFNPSMKSPEELNSLLSNSFVVSPGLLYHLIRRDPERLSKEAFTSNLTVSSK